MRHRIIVVGISLFVCATAGAREFRGFKAVPSPKRLMKKGAKPVKQVQPLDSKKLQEAVRDAVTSWNNGDLSDKLDETFYDKDRLLDSISEKVPRDAKVRVLAVRNVEILQQYRGAQAPTTTREGLTSLVTATVRTQIEYTDPKKGFQRIEGVNELILRIEAERVD